MSHQELRDLTPLYALDALEGQELAEFEAHLPLCGECGRELDEYRGSITSLVGNEPGDDATWDRISEAISEDLAKVVPLPRPESRAMRWLASIAAIAALVFAGLLFSQIQQSPTETIVTAAEQAASEPDSIVEDFVVDDIVVAQVVLTSDGVGFVLPSNELATLDLDRTYQLWVINGPGDVISAGVLGASPVPSTFTWTGEVSGFALTREVAGGVVSSAGDVVSVITDV